MTSYTACSTWSHKKYITQVETIIQRNDGKPGFIHHCKSTGVEGFSSLLEFKIFRSLLFEFLSRSLPVFSCRSCCSELGASRDRERFGHTATGGTIPFFNVSKLGDIFYGLAGIRRVKWKTRIEGRAFPLGYRNL